MGHLQKRLGVSLFALLALFPTGCGEDAGPGIPPSVSNITAEANPHNLLSSTIVFDAANAESARVVYWRNGGFEKATPFYPVRDGANKIATLGLRPSTEYFHVVEAKGRGGDATTDTVSYTSGNLPTYLQSISLNITGNSPPGYVLMGLPAGYVAIFDETGSIRWYHFIEGYVGRDVGQKSNGNFSAFIGSATGHQAVPGHFIEFLPNGEEVAVHAAPSPLYTDNHELLLTTSESGEVSSHFFSYEIRTVDLSSYGGPSDASIAGHQILRMTNGFIDYEWDAWDDFSIEDAVEEPGLLTSCTECDFDHPNSLAFDLDGNYLASFRHMSEITTIDSRTGEIIWRLGGNNNQFTFLNDPQNGFSAQHFARILPNGNLLLYDNGVSHSVQESRAVEYELDTDAMTATMVWEYRHDPAIFTLVVGSVQRLATGNTFVGFGWAATMVEVSPSGEVVWEATLEGQNIMGFYRALRVASLYEYVAP